MTIFQAFSDYMKLYMKTASTIASELSKLLPKDVSVSYYFNNNLTKMYLKFEMNELDYDDEYLYYCNTYITIDHEEGFENMKISVKDNIDLFHEYIEYRSTIDEFYGRLIDLISTQFGVRLDITPKDIYENPEGVF